MNSTMSHLLHPNVFRIPLRLLFTKNLCSNHLCLKSSQVSSCGIFSSAGNMQHCPFTLCNQLFLLYFKHNPSFISRYLCSSMDDKCDEGNDCSDLDRSVLEQYPVQPEGSSTIDLKRSTLHISCRASETDVPSELTEALDVDVKSSGLHVTIEPCYYLAPFVSKSYVLQQLLKLGVDLSAVEKWKDAADFILQADWKMDIKPRLLFLHDAGIDKSCLPYILSRNPLIFKEDVNDMHVRLNYLAAKKFKRTEIGHIVSKAPLFLLLPVKIVDRKLGFLQKTFHLSGDEVRTVAIMHPKIIPWKLQKLKDMHFYMMEFLGFSRVEMKKMLMKAPRVFLSGKTELGKRFDYLYNSMDIDHKLLADWPAVFRSRLHIIQQRHRFLILQGRAQYDPKKENYVSMKALVSQTDAEFCRTVAKAPESLFVDFMKCL